MPPYIRNIAHPLLYSDWLNTDFYQLFSPRHLRRHGNPFLLRYRACLDDRFDPGLHHTQNRQQDPETRKDIWQQFSAFYQERTLFSHHHHMHTVANKWQQAAFYSCYPVFQNYCNWFSTECSSIGVSRFRKPISHPNSVFRFLGQRLVVLATIS